MTTAGTIYDALQNQGGGAGMLSYVSATQLKFIPFGGNFIRIGGNWYGIPAAGVTAANTNVFVEGVAGQNLNASTVYFVYLFANAGNLAVDFSVTGHVTSATANNVGTETKAGDDTRSLIGYIRTNASAQFANDRTHLWVRSWFNREFEQLGLGIGRNTQFKTFSTAFVSTGMLLDFLTWQDELVSVSLVATTFNDAGRANSTTFWWDGAATSVHHAAYHADGYGNWMSNEYTESKMLNEGRHTVEPAFRTISASTIGATMSGGAPGVYPTFTARIN